MTPWMVVTLGLAIAGQIVYHIGQRAVPPDASPMVVLAIAYFAAGALCVAIAWPLGAFTGAGNLRSALSWPTWLIVLSIVAIEVGYLTAYRAGWTLGTAFSIASTVTVFGLALVGRMTLGNSLSVRQLIGLGVSGLALWLLSTGSQTG